MITFKRRESSQKTKGGPAMTTAEEHDNGGEGSCHGEEIRRIVKIKMRNAPVRWIGAFTSKALSFLVVALLNLPLSAGADEHGMVQSLDRAHLAVWKIHNIQPGEAFGDRSTHNRGTAFAIKPDLFVTNAHVLRGMGRTPLHQIRLSQKGNHRQLTVRKVRRLSYVYDLALIRTHEQVGDYLGGAPNSSPSQLNQLTLIGYPKGVFHEINQISETSYNDIFSYIFVIVVDKKFGRKNDALAGSSGGPILNRRGQLVGIAVAAEYNIASGIKLERLKDFLQGEERVLCYQHYRLSPCLRKGWEHLEQRAREGNTIAQYQYWDYLTDEQRENSHQATTYIQQAAEKGFAPAQYFTSMHCMKKRNMKSPFPDCHKWVEEAAKRGEPSAIYFMGYYKHQENMGSYWLRKALELGVAPAESFFR